MTLRQDLPDILQFVQDSDEYVRFQSEMFRIYEGNLMESLQRKLQNELSPQSYDVLKDRIAPINILARLVDKLSKIYQHPVTRIAVDGSDQDSDLLDWYEDELRVDRQLNLSNEIFNLSRSSLLQPFAHRGKPHLRAIPAGRYLVYSNDQIDPTRPTHVILLDQRKTFDGSSKTILIVWSEFEFVIIDVDGQVQLDLMLELGNPEGFNPFGRLPFTYVNKSSTCIMPPEDRDSYQMSLLIPVLLSDLNYAVKFQAFSILYIIGGKSENLAMNPNSVWEIEKSPDQENNPEIGSIKPNVDISETLGMIQGELAFWLNSRGIKPGSVGQLQGESFASGVSKMIDEMDTAEDRQKQVVHYKDAEADLWDLILNYMHPIWARTGAIENRAVWTPSATVETLFPEQIPMVSRGDMVRDYRDEHAAGFTSKRRAIAALNPGITDDELDELIKEIEDERTVVVEEDDDDQQEGLPVPPEVEEDEEGVGEIQEQEGR